MASLVELPCDRTRLAFLSGPQILEAIRMRRKAIRYHRDQVGDDRCFIDDWRVWIYLDDTPPRPHYTLVQGMALCERFYEYRRSDEVVPLSSDANPNLATWNDDLSGKDHGELLEELVRVQYAIRAHRDSGDSVENDRRFYAVLPEKLNADFRLGSEEEFLGEAKAPYAGCTSFWLSHEKCNPLKCDQYGWGAQCPK